MLDGICAVETVFDCLNQPLKLTWRIREVFIQQTLPVICFIDFSLAYYQANLISRTYLTTHFFYLLFTWENFPDFNTFLA